MASLPVCPAVSPSVHSPVRLMIYPTVCLSGLHQGLLLTVTGDCSCLVCSKSVKVSSCMVTDYINKQGICFADHDRTTTMLIMLCKYGHIVMIEPVKSSSFCYGSTI